MRINEAWEQSLARAINLGIYARLRALPNKLDLVIFNDNSCSMQNT
jgi:hypothetical protein